MKISFLVTFYNQAEYVDQCLNSIKNIDLPDDYEIIVGDDGSTDGTLEKIDSWKSKFGDHLLLIKNSREDGIKDHVMRASNMRKKLLAESKGEYFCVVDGDDYYCNKTFVKKAINILEANQNVSTMMFDFQKVTNEKDDIQKYTLNEVEGNLKNSIYVRNYYMHVGGCVFRRYSKQITEDLLSAPYYDDTDIILYNLNFGNLDYCKLCVYCYRQTGHGLWTGISRSVQGLLNLVGCDNEILLSPKYKEEIIYRYRTDILYCYLRIGFEDYYYGSAVYRKYLSISKRMLNGISPIILDYNNVSFDEKKSLETIILHIKEVDNNTYSRIVSNVGKEINIHVKIL
jgi:glycosyltransferase involved in cell wall biosynthesis